MKHASVRADYELVIRPSHGWFQVNLADVWQYRDLLFLLVPFEARAKRRGSRPLPNTGRTSNGPDAPRPVKAWLNPAKADRMEGRTEHPPDEESARCGRS